MLRASSLDFVYDVDCILYPRLCLENGGKVEFFGFILIRKEIYILNSLQ